MHADQKAWREYIKDGKQKRNLKTHYPRKRYRK